MDKKITLFTSSVNSFSLIDYLIKQNLLSCIVVLNKNDMDSTNFINTLQYYKIPFFIYSNEDENLERLKKTDTNLGLIFDFNLKISQNTINFFKNSIFNIHLSPLPNYKGINPLFWQLKYGEKFSAITIHKLTSNFNDGDIVFTKKFEINTQDTFGISTAISSQLIVSSVEEFLSIFDNKINASAQMGNINYNKKITQNDIAIDWKNMTSLDIYNLCRACNPIFGGAKTIWKNSILSILEATIVDMNNLGLEAGTIIHIGYPEGFIVSTIDGAIRLEIVSVPDGIFTGLRFAKRFNIEVCEKLN